MTIFELALISAGGIAIALAFGLIGGISYQKAEDRRTMRKMQSDHRKEIEAIRKASADTVSQAYRIAKDKIQKQSDEEWMRFLNNINELPFENDIKYGGF